MESQPSSHVVQAEREEVLTTCHIPYLGKSVRHCQEHGSLRQGRHCPSIYLSVNAGCICHVLLRSRPGALSPTSLRLLRSTGIWGKKASASIRGRNDTKELLIQARQKRPGKVLSSPSTKCWGRPRPAHRDSGVLTSFRGKPRRPPLHVATGQMDLDEPRFPVVLRNNFAAVIFALIVQGAVFVR